MEKENIIEKKKSHSFFMILVIVLLLVIAISSILNTFYLFTINTKLSLLPNMNFSGIENSLKQIGDTLNINMLDIFK